MAQQRFVDVAPPDERTSGLRGAPLRCALPSCGAAAGGVLCDEHWFALPWSMRNSAGPAHAPPARASREWLRSALAALAPQASYRATAPLTQEEQRFRPVALRILAEHPPRPATSGECRNRGRQMPCPYVSCPSHLYLEVMPSGTLHFNFPGKEVWELEETCADLVAEKGGVGRTRAGALVGLKRGRVGQIERKYVRECRKRDLAP